jgi:hypothetical protein
VSGEQLWTGNFENREAFAAWAGKIAADGAEWALLERVPDRWMTEPERAGGLLLERYNTGLPIERYECGYLFCSRYELRWESSGAAVSAQRARSPHGDRRRRRGK